MLKRFSLTVAGLLLLGCATTRPAAPELQLIYGTAYQRCADLKDKDFPQPHAHLTFRAVAPQAKPGDTLTFLVANKAVTFDATLGLVNFNFPAGLGGHTVRVEWRTSSGELVRSGEMFVSVWLCDPVSIG